MRYSPTAGDGRVGVEKMNRFLSAQSTDQLCTAKAYFNIVISASRLFCIALRTFGVDTHESLKYLLPFKRLIKNLADKNYIMKAQGVNFIYDSADLINMKIALVGCHEYEVTHFVENNVQKSWVVLDVGANLGYFSLLSAARARNGRVIAVEPADINFRRLIRNIEANPFQNVTCIKKIIWKNSSESLPLYITDPSNLGSISVQGEGVAESRVETMTIDDLIGDMSLERIDVVKIDVEGAEYEVFMGMQHCLAELQPKFLLIEISRREKAKIIVEGLSWFGYREVDFYSLRPLSHQKRPICNHLFMRER